MGEWVGYKGRARAGAAAAATGRHTHPPKFAFEASTVHVGLPRQAACTSDSDEPEWHAPSASAPQLPVGVPYEAKSMLDMYAPAGQVSVAEEPSATASAHTVVVVTVH